MATIVQPYNDWRERAAVNILGPMMTGLLQRHWQNEDNRKVNALAAKAWQDVNNRQPTTGLLQGQPEPEGYNADPWASAFHQTENPIANYDIATTGLVPVQSLQKAPTMADYIGAQVSNGGTRRFGHVPMQAAVSAMPLFLQANEQARQERGVTR